jgi:hypothetical protein
MFNKETKPDLPWNKQAEDALEQASSQVPGPKFVANQLKKRLRSKAEEVARTAGHEEVKPEDLMEGLLAMLPENMRETVEQRMAEGPEGIEKLKNEFTK